MMKQPARLYKLLVFSRLAMLETNGMKLSGGARRGMCAGCDGGGGYGRGGQGGRWKQEQGANAMTMNHDGTCLNNGFGRGGQGRGYRGGGYGQGGRWNQEQVADDAAMTMDTDGRGLHNGFGRGGQGRGYRGGGYGQGGRWNQEQVADDAAVMMDTDGRGLHNGFGRGGQGRGYRGGGYGQGGRWNQEQVADDAAVMMDTDGRGLHNGFGRGGQGRGYGGGGYGQGGRWNQVDDDTSVMTNPRVGQHHQGGRNSGDRATIQNLIDNRQHIHRTVEKTPDGIQTHTWSHEKQVSDWIAQHVHSMKDRMEEGKRIRQRDPLFVAAFDHAHLIDDFVVEEEDNGVKVTETSRDPCTVDILHSHSDVVSGFIEHGRYEVRRNHPVPSSCPAVTPGSCSQAAGKRSVRNVGM